VSSPDTEGGGATVAAGGAVVARLHASANSIAPGAWNALLAPDDAPFLRHEWFAALEASGAASPARGFAPAHLGLYAGDDLVGLAPLYLRDRAEWDFVWEFAIEEACRRARLPYTPRAVASIPMTPVPGRRFLTRPERRAALLPEFASALQDLLWGQSESADGRSLDDVALPSVHVHFAAPDEVAALAALGFIERRQWQYQFPAHRFESFDAALAAFRSRRRSMVLRELREVQAAGLRLGYLPGAAATAAHWTRMGELYADTSRRNDGREIPLPVAFFEMVGASALAADLGFLCAFRDGHPDFAEPTDSPVAMGLVGRSSHALYGRVWGAAEQVPFLHFAVAYYAGMRLAIELRCERYEPGHGGEHKFARGFDPVPVHTMHAFVDGPLSRGVTAWAARERAAVDAQLDELRAQSAYRAS
jgi:predicted N-acyltransferase